MEKLRALLIAPPGAGKGTQSDRICSHFEITHISTGDIFRAEVARASDIGRIVRGYLSRGDLVPDDVVGQIVHDAVLAAMRTAGGFLLDGFPRTLPQAEAAHELAIEIGLTAHAVLTFDVPRAVLLERLMSRAGAEGRGDDTEEVIRHRLEVYDKQTAPLLDYYEGLGVLVRIDANRPVDDVTEASISALTALQAGSSVG
jgi:adenylate kinase